MNYNDDEFIKVIAEYSKKQYLKLFSKAMEAVEDITGRMFPESGYADPLNVLSHYPGTAHRAHRLLPPDQEIFCIAYGGVDENVHWTDTDPIFNQSAINKLGVQVYVSDLTYKSKARLDTMVPKKSEHGPLNIIRSDSKPRLYSNGGDGVEGIGAGTIGCVVEKNGTKYILSASHVLGETAHVSNKVHEIVSWIPYPVIGELSESVDIDKTTGATNLVDAAIAEIDACATVNSLINSIGKLASGNHAPELYLGVRMHGHFSSHSIGMITGVGAKATFTLGTASVQFDEQLKITNVGSGKFASPGDSGALVVDSTTRMPVGLLIGGDCMSAYATPIEEVLNQFGVTIVT